jgi:hypothetical protein
MTMRCRSANFKWNLRLGSGAGFVYDHPMADRVWHLGVVVLVGAATVACKAKSSQPDAAPLGGSAVVSAAAPPSQSAPASPADGSDVDAQSWIPWLSGSATRDNVRFGLATCFTETKHCVQFPLGWRNDGRPKAMGDGKIAWGYPSNRHVCMSVDRGGSDWAELIRRDEAEQKGFSAPLKFKMGPDELPATLRVKRLDMATTRPYPFNILMWFGCFGVDPVAAGNPTGMPSGSATLFVIKLDIKSGLTFNAYGFLSDEATEDEKRDLFGTLRGIRSLPGKLATHPK